MEETIEFYGFRGNIIFPDQVTLFSMGFENKSKDKNQVFKKFFEDLKENGRVDSEYQKRRYYLIFINQYDSIIHCQLARERISDKYEMTKEKIVGTKDKDFPFTNVFIELETQKFLIEYKSTIFKNHTTCGDVIQNIMNKYLKTIDATININPIAEEQEFWKYFENDNEVKNLNFNLTVPNLFDASDDATDFLNDARDNVGASNVSLNFSNSEGKLRPNKDGIESFVKYTSAGGGQWRLTYKDKDGQTRKASSKQKNKKICLKFFEDEINQLNEDKIKLIRFEMQKIETIEKFKEKIDEKEDNDN